MSSPSCKRTIHIKTTLVSSLLAMKMERGYDSSLFADRSSVSPFTPMPMESSGFVSTISVDEFETLIPLPSSVFSNPSFSHEVFNPYLPQNHRKPSHDSFVSDSLLSPIALYQTDSTQVAEFLSLVPSTTTSFFHLPDLQPVEETANAASSFSSLPPLSSSLSTVDSLRQRWRFGPLTDPHASSQTLDSFVQSGFFRVSSSSSSSSTRLRENTSPSPMKSHGGYSRIRLRRIGDKTRSMQKLMPWNQKMNTASFLEAAYRYIKFLQAQVEVLRWMPIDSAFKASGDIGFLGMLNRQQLLQVILNSPSVQNMLYSQGFCVFSHEQLLFLKSIGQRSASL